MGRSWSLIGCIAPCAPEPINAPCRQLRGLSHDGPIQLRHNVFGRAVAPLAARGGLCRTPGDHRGGGVSGLRVSGGGRRPPCPARVAGPIFGRRRFTKRPSLHGRRAALARATIDARRGRMGDAKAGRRRGWRRPSRRFLASFSRPLGGGGARPRRGRGGDVRRRRAPIGGIEKGRACRRFTSRRRQTRELRRRSRARRVVDELPERQGRIVARARRREPRHRQGSRRQSRRPLERRERARALQRRASSRHRLRRQGFGRRGARGARRRPQRPSFRVADRGTRLFDHGSARRRRSRFRSRRKRQTGAHLRQCEIPRSALRQDRGGVRPRRRFFEARLGAWNGRRH